MILLFDELKPEIIIKFFNVVLDLLVETARLIAIDFRKVGIQHNFYATDGVNQVFDAVRRFYAYKFLHGDSKNGTRDAATRQR